MKLSDHQQLFTRNIAKLISYAHLMGFGLSFGHAWRSPEEQQRLFDQGLSRTHASQHLSRLAVDFNVFLAGRLCLEWSTIKILGDYWESLHPDNRWGGDWNGNELQDGFIDCPHFEMVVKKS